MRFKSYRTKDGKLFYTINNITKDEFKLIRSLLSRLQPLDTDRHPLIINEYYGGFELPFLQLVTEVPLLPTIDNKLLVLPYSVLSSIQKTFVTDCNRSLLLPVKDSLCDFNGYPLSNLPF